MMNTTKLGLFAHKIVYAESIETYIRRICRQNLKVHKHEIFLNTFLAETETIWSQGFDLTKNQPSPAHAFVPLNSIK
jgi:hypothetical protein